MTNSVALKRKNFEAEEKMHAGQNKKAKLPNFTSSKGEKFGIPSESNMKNISFDLDLKNYIEAVRTEVKVIKF